jgi:glutathione S-transferase
VPRLKKWMSFWEETGRRYGLEAERGLLLGGDGPGIAVVVSATLWTTMADRFSDIAVIFVDASPRTSALVRRVSSLPGLTNLVNKARTDYGDAYCGGVIEVALCKVADTSSRRRD